MQVRCVKCGVVYTAGDDHKCKRPLPGPSDSTASYLNVQEATSLATAERVVVRPKRPEVCPTCGQPIKTPAKTNAERQREWRKRRQVDG